MTDRPIIFGSEMIRALLAGTKTQTRRLISSRMPWADLSILGDPDTKASDLAPYVKWKAGDRLWVREAWARLTDLAHADCGTQALADGCFYRADDGTVEGEIPRWRSPIHMPRRASRITLTVTDVRVQRLQDISEDDARAEGIEASGFWRKGHPPSICFSVLWDSIHGREAWDANPWVAALSFTVACGNIDTPVTRARGAQT